MDYEKASIEDIAKHFSTVSRQRIAQVVKAHRDRGKLATLEKIESAKELLREWRHVGKYGYDSTTNRRLNALWSGMKSRCGILAAYMDCTIGFESITHFKSWAVEQVGFFEGFELDKDVLVKGNRVYSPQTCVFVPLEINSMLSNCYRARNRGKYPVGVCYNKGSRSFVAQMGYGNDKYLGSFKTAEEAFACYKAAKEAKIKRLAEKWKDRIDVRAYNALIARKIDIDD